MWHGEHLKVGDIVVVRGKGLLSRIVRWATRSVGEAKTKASHVGMIVKGGPLHKSVIQEAVWWVRRRLLGRAYVGSTADVGIYRLPLSYEERARLSVSASETVGRLYGAGKLLLHLGDALLGRLVRRDVSFFRQLARSPLPICSHDVATHFRRVGVSFGAPVTDVTPDHILDALEKHPKARTIRKLEPLTDRDLWLSERWEAVDEELGL